MGTVAVVSTQTAAQNGARAGMLPAFAGAVSLHVLALAAVAAWRPAPAFEAPGQNQITIDLAPAAVPIVAATPEIEQIAVVEPLPTMPETPPAETLTPVEPEQVTATEMPTKLPEVEAVAEIPPVTQPDLPQDLPPAIQPESVIVALALEPPPPTPQPEPKRESERQTRRERPTPKPAPPQPRQQAAARPVTPAALPAEIGGQAAAALQSERSAYAGRLIAAIRRALRHPGGTRTGTVLIRLTLDRQGTVLSAAITRSAGDDALDNAAMEAIRRAAMPAMPTSFPDQRITVAAPVRFDIVR